MIYEIMLTQTIAEMEQDVNERLAEGWQLQGGPMLVGRKKCKSWIQAMVKYEQSTDSNTGAGGNSEPAGDTRPS